MNPPAAESQIMGVSIRAWIACALVCTVCFIYVIDALATVWLNLNGGSLEQKISEPLYTLAIMAVSFYLGNKTAKPPEDSNTSIITK
jgi:hypothetical protein